MMVRELEARGWRQQRFSLSMIMQEKGGWVDFDERRARWRRRDASEHAREESEASADNDDGTPPAKEGTTSSREEDGWKRRSERLTW